MAAATGDKPGAVCNVQELMPFVLYEPGRQFSGRLRQIIMNAVRADGTWGATRWNSQSGPCHHGGIMQILDDHHGFADSVCITGLKIVFHAAVERADRQGMAADRRNHPRRTIGRVEDRVPGYNVTLEKVGGGIFQDQAGGAGSSGTADTGIVIRQGRANRAACTIDAVTTAYVTLPGPAAGTGDLAAVIAQVELIPTQVLHKRSEYCIHDPT